MDRPVTYKIKSENPRLRILYPETQEKHDKIDAFTPAQAEPESFSKMDEAARGEITAFTPGMANSEDGITSVNGKPLDSTEPPYDPMSAIEPENPGYDELVKPSGADPAPKHTPETVSVLEEINQGFPNKPRPDMRMRK